MKISVIVAAYNVDLYIERCINSIINQSYRDFEIIIVNDGSTDETLRIINEIARNNEKIKVIDKNNEGLIEARKSGFNISKGEYILFVDGDDWLEEDALESLANEVTVNKYDIVCFNAYKSYDNNKQKFNIVRDNININDMIQSIFLNKILPAIWAKFIRKGFIDENKIRFPSNISCAEDLATVSNWFINKPKVKILNENLYNYYQRNDSISNKSSFKMLEVDKAIDFIIENLKEKCLFEKYKREIEVLIFNHMFIYGAIRNEKIDNVRYEMYKLYKKRNININKNSYIKQYVNKQNIIIKLRIIFYDKSCKLGQLYDNLRNLVKGRYNLLKDEVN